MNIIARKPRTFVGDSEYIVVDRGNGEFVSATATPHSLEHGEWFWGHYFPNLELAMAHFNGR